MTERVPYERRRNAALPWGYWCRTSGEEWPPLYDEAGNEWRSVREYFWTARLGMASASEHDREHALEVLLSILVAIDRRVIGIEEKVIDLFEDSWQLARQLVGHWLEGLGFTDDSLSGDLTPEGRAVLVMLASTRSRQAARIPIGLPVFKATRGPDLAHDPVMHDQVMAQCEAFAAKLELRFVRDDLAGRPAIKLIGPPEGNNVPLARTLWSMDFPRRYERDRVYRWLVDRIDRWETWAERARRHGAQALTDHLLRLRFAQEADDAQ
ncbi:hypothetical protein [Aurantiacibacter odishensis]|uniref:hypothetical protein n=1 Tax=Aurantiacibacter odishensis TaxID=1155476 RepID=UPI0013C48B6D|nr:hypothetical protein [Aurantiacibacter odishensis]